MCVGGGGGGAGGSVMQKQQRSPLLLHLLSCVNEFSYLIKYVLYFFFF